MLTKRIPYKNKKITKSANGEDCTLNSEFCNYDNETTVFCHLNEEFAGKGTSQKADDCAGFYGCGSCHYAFDNNLIKDWWMVLRAYYRTIRVLIDKGILK